MRPPREDPSSPALGGTSTSKLLNTLARDAVAHADLVTFSGGKLLARTAAAFRALPVPVIGHVADGTLRLDLRTLKDERAFLVQCAGIGAARAEGGWGHCA